MPIFANKNGVRVFYAHVPKTGGTYVEDLFRTNRYKCHLWVGQPDDLGLVVSPQHFHHDLYSQFIDLDQFSFSFITVRNPVDRLLSEYRHQNQNASHTLQDWLKHTAFELDNNGSINDNHLRPQVHFLDPRMQVFRQEEGFGRDWALRISSEYGLGFRSNAVRQTRETQSKQRSLSDVEMTALAKFAQRHYADDFDRFGYSIESSFALGAESDRRPPRQPAAVPRTTHVRRWIGRRVPAVAQYFARSKNSL